MSKYICFILILLSSNLYSNNLQLSNVTYNPINNKLKFTLSWENSWRTSNDAFDAAWIFAKYAPNGGSQWLPVTFADSVYQASIFQQISFDDLGVMIGHANNTFNDFGPITIELFTHDLIGDFQDIKIFATEMVYVPEGPFYAGDGVSDFRIYQSGNSTVPLYIDSEDELIRGSGPGEFDQQILTYTNDIPDDYPKGYAGFYSMKYKVSTLQYLDFLNCLSRTQQNLRTNTDLNQAIISNRYVMANRSTPAGRNGIKCDADLGTGPITFYMDLDEDDIPNEDNDGASIALSYVSISDMLAYLDWSGLRPMTELEFEKLCRGAYIPPIAGEYAWGSDTYNTIIAIVHPGQAIEKTVGAGTVPYLYSRGALRVGHSATSNGNRANSCATYYGIMDIHNLDEFMIGVEATDFSKWSYGDGNLDINGDAGVSDWTAQSAFAIAGNSIGSPPPISKGKIRYSPTYRSSGQGFRGVRKVNPNQN